MSPNFFVVDVPVLENLGCQIRRGTLKYFRKKRDYIPPRTTPNQPLMFDNCNKHYEPKG